MFDWLKKKPDRKLISQLEAVLPKGFVIPEAMVQFYDWIERRGYYVDTSHGRVGGIVPCTDQDAIFARREHEIIGGEYTEFAAEGSANVKYWFGQETTDQQICDRLCVFSKLGADGSMGAFWLDQSGEQKIVHMGSGSGSMMACILADSFVDFLRLLAIGYEELCWGGFSEAPDFSQQEAGDTLVPNTEFQKWVSTTFAVSIPAAGDEIVKHESEMHRENPQDPFCQWVQSLSPPV